MATIRSSIALHDGMTGPLRSINSMLGTLLDSLVSMHEASGIAFNTEQVSKMRTDIEKVTTQIDELEGSIENTRRSEQRLNKEQELLTSSIKKYAAAAASAFGIKQLLSLSDDMTSTNARLTMLVDDGGSVKELEEKIYASAQRSRSAYLDTASAVAKLGINAKDAFANNDEAIAFAELINKQFVIAGASVQEQQAAMLQLTQAIASGVLRGEELNSVFEQAPIIVQSIADYLDVPIGKIREMASDGEITADIVKKAMFAAADDINKKFDSMPMTWAQVWTVLSNAALKALQPVLTLINMIANNLDVIGPIVGGIAAIVAAYTAVLLINVAVTNAKAAAETMAAIAAVAHGTATAAEAAATTGMTEAQIAFNAALYACPITWIVLAVIALISVIFLVVAAINRVKGTSISAIGVITGTVSTAAAFILNCGIGLINSLIQVVWLFIEPFAGVIEWIANAFTGGFDTIQDACWNLLGHLSAALLNFGKIATKIIDAVFGTDYTSSLTGLQTQMRNLGKNDKAYTFNLEAPTINKRFSYSSAWEKGYNLGSGTEDKFSGLTNAIDMSSLAASAADTADNTDDIKDKLDSSEEELRLLREIAERQAINQFTTAQLHIEMNNNNTITGVNDIDGIVEQLETRVEEAMIEVSEGEHI